MKTKNFWFFSSLIIGILILTAYALFFYNNRSQKEDNPFSDDQSQIQLGADYKLNTAYPRNLIEGVITSIEINPPERKFKIKVDLNQIFQEEISFDREITVLVSEDAEFFLLDVGTEVGTNITMEDFKEGDSIVVAIEEENSEILIRNTFTGVWVKKMVFP